MPQSPKIFGQQKPDANIDTNLFTVATSHSAQISIFVANQSNDYDTFTVALVPYSQSEQAENYLAYNTPLVAHGVIAFSGIYLSAGDRVQVSTTLGQCSFTATGLDIT